MLRTWVRVTSRQMFPERDLQKSTSLCIAEWTCCMWLYNIGTVMIVITVATVERVTPKKAIRRMEAASASMCLSSITKN